MIPYTTAHRTGPEPLVNRLVWWYLVAGVVIGSLATAALALYGLVLLARSLWLGVLS
jgi:hypothetical protein